MAVDPEADVESVLKEILDVVCPVMLPGQRGFKPLLSPTLDVFGVDLNQPTGRRLLPTRDYHRLDFEDFLEFATTELPKPPRLGSFADRKILFYDGFERSPNEPFLRSTTGNVGPSVLGCALVKKDVFLSSAVHCLVHGTDFKTPVVAIMTFAPPNNASDLARAGVVEWDRYFVESPFQTDSE